MKNLNSIKDVEQALKAGKKVRNIRYSPEEYLFLNENGQMETEDGHTHGNFNSEFWQIQKGLPERWHVVEDSEIRPKTEEKKTCTQELIDMLAALDRMRTDLLFVCKGAHWLDKVYKGRMTIDDFIDWMEDNAPAHKDVPFLKEWLYYKSFKRKEGAVSVWNSWFDSDSLMSEFSQYFYMFSAQFMERITKEVEEQLSYFKKMNQ